MVDQYPGVAWRQVAPRSATVRGMLPLALLFGGALWWTWGRWPDAVVDFGRELYVAWRLAEGAVLYRDVMYVNGPLSPHLNALWMCLLGVGLRSIAMANAAIALLVLVLLWRLLVRLGSVLSATLACAVFVLVFAFAQQMPIGNYNFIAPYSHETTHGILIALAAVGSVGRLARSGSVQAAAACGLCLGLALLTKPELVLATGATTVGGGTLALLARRAPLRIALARAAVLCGAAVLPPLVAGSLLTLAMPAPEAFANAFGGLRWLGSSALASRFYLRMSGMLAPQAAVVRIAAWALAWSALLGAAVVLARALPDRGSNRVAPVAAFVAVLAALWALGDRIPWAQALLPLPLVSAGAVLGFAVGALRAVEPAARVRLVLGTAFALLALALLAKILLRARACDPLRLRARTAGDHARDRAGVGLAAAPRRCLAVGTRDRAGDLSRCPAGLRGGARAHLGRPARDEEPGRRHGRR